MEISPGIEIRGKALWIKKEKILIFGDLHIGYEMALEKRGIFVPRRYFLELKKEILELIKETNPKKILINGDLKHEFGEIGLEEWSEVLKILNLMKKSCEKLILIRGNHDSFLGPLAKAAKLEIVKDYLLEDRGKERRKRTPIEPLYFIHGDKILNNKYLKKVKTIIISHEHPAISLSEGGKKEKYKCFLKGKWKNKRLIVMPSFFSLLEGTDIKNEKMLSPYLHQKIDDFEVYILGDKVYKFGKLRLLK